MSNYTYRLNGQIIVATPKDRKEEIMGERGAKKEYWTKGEGLVEIKEWLRNGLTDGQIANNIGIAKKTIWQWKKENESFKNVFLINRRVAAVELENMSFKTAMGYYVNEQTLDNKGNKRMIRKWVAPAPTMQIYLLKNWLKDQYTDRKEVDLNAKLPVVIENDIEE